MQTTLIRLRHRRRTRWYQRLFHVLKIPFDVLRYVVTGNCDVINIRLDDPDRMR